MKGLAVDPGERRSAIDRLRNLPLVRGVGFCWQTSRAVTSWLVAIVVAGSAALLAATLAVGALIGSLDEERIPAGILVLAVTGWVLPLTLAPVASALQARLERKVEDRVWRTVMAIATEPAGIAHLEDATFLDEARRAEGLSWVGRPSRIVFSMRTVLAARLTAAWSIVVLAQFRVWASAVLVAAMLLQWSWFNRETENMAVSFFAGTEELRRARYFNELAVRPAAAKELRVFGLAEWVRGRADQHWATAMADVWRQRRRLNRSMFTTTVALAGAYGLVFLALGRSAANGSLSLERLVVFAQTALAFVNVGSQGQPDVSLREATRSLDVLGRLRAHPSVVAADLGGTSAGTGTEPLREIVIEGVGFAYPTSPPVFRSLDLRIEAGRSLAIVGANGAGKTTLIKLLARLYDPTSGRILVDGTDIRALDPEAWRRRVSVIFQDFARHELTAADNVGFDLDEPDLRRAAIDAGAEELVDGLPRGWDTMLARGYPDGTDLSGGQWQRIALARALASASPGGLLVLDEPTANLDVRAEAELFDRFLDLTKGLTTVLVSHRFSTVRRADRIVVIEHGAVVEDGTHEDLLQAAGRYAEMFELQARRFNDDDALVDREVQS